MEHRKTPPVLRRTKPELIADDERSRRSRRVRLGSGLAGGGVVIGIAAAVAFSRDGAIVPQAALAMAVGLALAITGLWLLRAGE